MNNNSMNEADNQQYDNPRNTVRKSDKQRRPQGTKKSSVPHKRHRYASNTFPSLTELPLHIQLLLVIILLMFVTNHVAVSDLILLLQLIQSLLGQ